MKTELTELRHVLTLTTTTTIPIDVPVESGYREIKMHAQLEIRKRSKPRMLPILALAIILTMVGGCRSKHSVTLNWQKAEAPQGTIIGYNIYRTTKQGGPYTPIASRVQGTSYKDESVSSGETYYYVVTSMDDAGHESPYSQEISAHVP